MYNFYISCPMGLENIVWDEISHKWEVYLSSKPPTPLISLGGIEIECELEDGLAINVFSKTANKILIRIKKQKCRDVPKLFNIISKIQWKTYLKRTDVSWNITCHESRLFNTKKIENACQDGLDKYFNANQLSQRIKDQKDDFHIQNIYLRFDNDELTISLDTSGELLHIRGGDKFRGHASIRSTLASCLLWKFVKNENAFSLLDPMCGTGTFLKEAENFYELSSKTFPFQDWNKPLTFNKLLKDLPYESLHGLDIDQNIIKKNKLNNSIVNYQVQDLFTKSNIQTNDLIVICNPPYGKRVKLSKPREIFFQEIVDSLISNYSPKKIGIILPQDIKLKQKSKKIKIFNSGIWLNFHEIT